MALTCSPWIDAEALGCDVEGTDPEVVAQAIEAASDMLYAMTAEVYPGVCTDTYRPCGCSCGSTRCGCRSMSTFEPRRSPMIDVTAVKVDGVALVRGVDWQVLDGRLLHRMGDRSWPCGQNLDRADSEADTWSVTYTFGGEPPAAGRIAAAVLACELLAAWSGGTCRLPKRLQTASGEGWSQVFLDPFAFLDNGVFGVAELDYFVRSVNPDGLRRQGKYLSPADLERGWSVTPPPGP